MAGFTGPMTPDAGLAALCEENRLRLIAVAEVLGSWRTLKRRNPVETESGNAI